MGDVVGLNGKGLSKAALADAHAALDVVAVGTEILRRLIEVAGPKQKLIVIGIDDMGGLTHVADADIPEDTVIVALAAAYQRALEYRRFGELQEDEEEDYR